MESTDRELILNMLKSNIQLKRLYDEHLMLESALSGLGSRPFLTTEEAMEERRLKKQKLLGVDKMISIITPYRSAA